MPRRMAPSRRPLARLATGLLLVVLAAGCGGGSGSSGPDDPGNGGPTFPDRGGGETTEPPPSVRTARVAFDSDSGERCCVALPAEFIPVGALLVLDDLPAGPATVSVDFFAEDFAPGIPGFDACPEPDLDGRCTCATLPVTAGRPCDPTRVAPPSFESDPQRVDIIPGGQTNVDPLDVHALPFVFDFTPENGDTVEDPVAFAFTVADPVTDVEEESVVLELTLQEPVGSSFRPLTKRVALHLDECTDGTAMPCSMDEDRELAGFVAQSDSTLLLPGPVDVQILAINQDDPPREVDFRYSFEVLE